MPAAGKGKALGLSTFIHMDHVMVGNCHWLPSSSQLQGFSSKESKTSTVDRMTTHFIVPSFNFDIHKRYVPTQEEFQFLSAWALSLVRQRRRLPKLWFLWFVLNVKGGGWAQSATLTAIFVSEESCSGGNIISLNNIKKALIFYIGTIKGSARDEAAKN